MLLLFIRSAHPNAVYMHTNSVYMHSSFHPLAQEPIMPYQIMYTLSVFRDAVSPEIANFCLLSFTLCLILSPPTVLKLA